MEDINLLLTSDGKIFHSYSEELTFTAKYLFCLAVQRTLTMQGECENRARSDNIAAKVKPSLQ